jgi:hypothetical protein
VENLFLNDLYDLFLTCHTGNPSVQVNILPSQFSTLYEKISECLTRLETKRELTCESFAAQS